MAEMYEAAVAVYLTCCGQIYISPQHIIDWDKGLREGGCVPDFVALDFGERHVVIVEVTTRSDVDPIVRKLRARNENWYRPVIRSLIKLDVINDTWKVRSLVFMRKCFLLKASGALPDGDVTFSPLEEAIHSWEYWKTRRNGRLPGADRFSLLPSLHQPEV